MMLTNNVEKVSKIGYQNIVSKEMKFYFRDFEKESKKFLEGIVQQGYDLKGPFFYTLNNVPVDKLVSVEMFMPIYNSSFENKTYKFSSYFELESLLKIVVPNDIEKMTEFAYAELLSVIEDNNWEMVTPFYHFIPMNGLPYIEIFVGYCEKEKVGE